MTVTVSLEQNGLSGKPNSGVFTFTMPDVVMGVSDTSVALLWMVITPRRKPSSNTTAAYGTVVDSATLIKPNEMSW